MSFELTAYRTTKLTRKERISRAKQELESMNDKLRAEFEEIKKIINDRLTSNVREVWNLGKRIKRIHEAEHEYGARAVERMSICLGYDRGLLYLAMRFFVSYDEEQLDALLKMRSKFGGCTITLSHLSQLLRIQNVKERTKLQKRIFEEDLSPEETMAEVNKLEGPSGRAGIGGRPLKVPATTMAMVNNVIHQSYFWERNYNNLWDHGERVVKMVEDMPSDKATPEFIKKLEDSVDYMERIREGAEIMKERLEYARELAVRKAEHHARFQAGNESRNGELSNVAFRGKARRRITSAN